MPRLPLGSIPPLLDDSELFLTLLPAELPWQQLGVCGAGFCCVCGGSSVSLVCAGPIWRAFSLSPSRPISPGWSTSPGTGAAAGALCPGGSFCEGQQHDKADCTCAPGNSCEQGSPDPEGVVVPQGFWGAGGTALQAPCEAAPGSYCPEGCAAVCGLARASSSLLQFLAGVSCPATCGAGVRPARCLASLGLCLTEAVPPPGYRDPLSGGLFLHRRASRQGSVHVQRWLLLSGRLNAGGRCAVPGWLLVSGSALEWPQRVPCGARRLLPARRYRQRA